MVRGNAPVGSRVLSSASPTLDKPDGTTELLRRAQAGDDDALEALLTRLTPALQRWASGRLPRWARDRADTRDLVQETLIKVLPHLRRFASTREGALHAYFRQAVLNRIRDEIRRAKRAPDRESLDPELPDPEVSPLELAIGRQALDRYEAALARLRPLDRQAIIGRVELGYSFTELAATLGKPTAEAARLTVTRAIVRLGREMRRAF